MLSLPRRKQGPGFQSPQPLLCLHASRKLPRLRAAKWILISAKAAGKLRADLFVLRPRLCLFVPEPEQNIHLPLSKQKASGLRKWLGFLVNVPVWSALNLTLIQRVRSSILGDRKKPSCGRDGIMTDWSLAQGKNYIRYMESAIYSKTS